MILVLSLYLEKARNDKYVRRRRSSLTRILESWSLYCRVPARTGHRILLLLHRSAFPFLPPNPEISLSVFASEACLNPINIIRKHSLCVCKSCLHLHLHAFMIHLRYVQLLWACLQSLFVFVSTVLRFQPTFLDLESNQIYLFSHYFKVFFFF